MKVHYRPKRHLVIPLHFGPELRMFQKSVLQTSKTCWDDCLALKRLDIILNQRLFYATHLCWVCSLLVNYYMKLPDVQYYTSYSDTFLQYRMDHYKGVVSISEIPGLTNLMLPHKRMWEFAVLGLCHCVFSYFQKGAIDRGPVEILELYLQALFPIRRAFLCGGLPSFVYRSTICKHQLASYLILFPN